MTCANAAKAFKVRIIQTFCPRLAFIANFDWLLALAVMLSVWIHYLHSKKITWKYILPISDSSWTYISIYGVISYFALMSDRKYVWATGGSHYLHLPGIVPSFCEILYLHLICTQLSTSPIRRRRTDRKGEQICNFQMNKYRFSKWINTFSNPTNTSVETFPNEFPSPRQHLLHPGTMGKSHTQHPTSDNSPSLPKSKKRWYSQKDLSDMSPNFLFYRANFIITWWNRTIPLKEIMMRIVGTYIWWSKLVFVRSLAFCNLVPSVQANIWPPGTLIVSMEWSWYCHYYLSSLEFWDKTDLPPRE